MALFFDDTEMKCTKCGCVLLNEDKIFTLENTSCYCTLGFHIIPAISSITGPQSTNSASAACKQRLSHIEYKCFQSKKKNAVLGPVWNW